MNVNENNKVDILNSLIKLFYVIFLLNISNKISESNYVHVLHQLNHLGFEPTHISDVENMIFYLENKGFKQSYVMTMLLYLKNDIFDSIKDLENNYDKLCENINCDDSNKKIDRIISIKEFLKNRVMIIKAFSKLCPPPKDEIVMKNMKPILSKATIRLCFNTELKEELINRLFQIRNHFDLDILKYMDVELKMYKEVKDMDVLMLTKYYMSCISTIKSKLTHWVCLCDAYLDAELSYLKSIKKVQSNGNHVISFDFEKFDLIIVDN